MISKQVFLNLPAVFLLIIPGRIHGGIIAIINQTPYCVEIKLEIERVLTKGKRPTECKFYYWVRPSEDIMFQLFGEEKKFKISAIYCKDLKSQDIDALNEGRMVPHLQGFHRVQVFPEILGEWFYFDPSEEYINLLYRAKYLPIFIISSYKYSNKPIIDFPQDVKALQAVIEKAKQEHLAKIKKEVREAVPYLPSGGGGEGGITGLIGEYAFE